MPTRLSAAAAGRARRSSTSSTRCWGTAAMWAATARVLRPLRPAHRRGVEQRADDVTGWAVRRTARRRWRGRGRAGEAGDHPQGGRLAGTVGSEEAGHRPAVAGEGDVVDDGNPVVAFGQRFSSNHAASVVAPGSPDASATDVIRAAIGRLRRPCRPSFRRCRRAFRRSAGAANTADGRFPAPAERAYLIAAPFPSTGWPQALTIPA